MNKDEQKKLDEVKKSWGDACVVLISFLFIVWFNWVLWQGNFWSYIALAVAIILIALFVLTPLIIAVSDTIEYIKERRKPIDPPDDIYECESDDDIAEKQQAIADAIDSRIKEKEFINKEE